VSGPGFVIAAYVGSALLYGVYTVLLRRRERQLERALREAEDRG
jgi:hypothetical protein